MLELQDRPLTPDEARAIAAWAYVAPFDLYDLAGDDALALLTARDSRGHGYYPVVDGAWVPRTS